MYEKAFTLEIVTPEKVVFQGEATSLSAPGSNGGFQILYDHAPFLSSIEVGVLKVKDPQGKEIVYATSGGFVEVKNNSVVVLAETAEKPEEIDVTRATAARDRANERLHSRRSEIDEVRARAALVRAVNRLRLRENA